MKIRVLITLAAVVFLSWPIKGMAQENAYVGSQACRDCHEQEYENFMKYSKKAKSFQNIKKMEKKVSPEEYRECFQCHTTGYGKKGGFISETRTPEMKNPGCEVCHGPGSRHVESEDPDDIVAKMAMEDCMACHNEERVEAFDFKPLLYSGGH